MDNKKNEEIEKLRYLQKDILEKSIRLLHECNYQGFLSMFESFLVLGEEILNIKKGEKNNGK